MLSSPILGKFLVLGLLSVAWGVLFKRAMRLDPSQPYHLASYRRDQSKARFYYLSVWIGLAAVFLSFVCLETLSNATFDSRLVREWMLAVVHGVGIWGLLIAGMVWTQVGQRVSQPNSDGQSLIPTAEKETGSRQ